MYMIFLIVTIFYFINFIKLFNYIRVYFNNIVLKIISLTQTTFA